MKAFLGEIYVSLQFINLDAYHGKSQEQTFPTKALSVGMTFAYDLCINISK